MIALQMKGGTAEFLDSKKQNFYWNFAKEHSLIAAKAQCITWQMLWVPWVLIQGLYTHLSTL